MKSRIFLFLSHWIGHNSNVVPTLNVTLSMCLNIILSVVCVGYITFFLLFFIPILPSSIAVGISVLVLGSALPFEFLNSKTQNEDSCIQSPDGYKYPRGTQFIMLLTSAMGAMQYLIRNYSLVFNFSKTKSGSTFLFGLSRIGYPVTAAKFSVWGGLSAFAFHFLLSYSNWDKYTKFHGKDEDTLSQATLLWVLLGAAVLLEMSLSMRSLIVAGFMYWAYQRIEYPQRIKAAVQAIKIMIKDVGQAIKDLWMRNTHICLPMGAFLYGIVDFCNSYAIVTQLGWLNTFTMGVCASFGVVSFLNISTIWAYNMVRFKYRGIGREVNANEKFVRLYYCDPSIRRLMIYLREGMLCGLDIMSNRIIVSAVSHTMLNVFGVSVGLTMLNLCTVCFALNKVIIMMFQSGVENREYLSSDSYKYTPAAKFAQRVTTFIEEDLPNQLFGVGMERGKTFS